MPKRSSCTNKYSKKHCGVNQRKMRRPRPRQPLPPRQPPRPQPRPQPPKPFPLPQQLPFPLPPFPLPQPMPFPLPQPFPLPPKVKKEYVSVDLYTAYLGKVSVLCLDLGNGKYALEAEVMGLNGKPILVKCVDAVSNRINAENPQPLAQLAQMKSTVVDVEENKRAWHNKKSVEKVMPRCGKGFGQSEDLKNLVLLDAVDIHFQTQNYIKFLHETLNINSVEVPPVGDQSVVVSIHNVLGVDNAFFTGECMIYGNGNRMFKPLGCVDVTGHELGHSFSKQEYVGHAGALNESFADVMGVSFEFWLYKKYSNISGVSDWTIGEDVGSAIKFLRNMADPTQADEPQPKLYRGQFWANPNSRQDNGGVHTNSGVSNYCFYLCAQQMSLLDALRLFFDCFRSLSARATFIEFRDKLVRCCGNDETMLDIVRGALDAVGLTKDAVSDWK